MVTVPRRIRNLIYLMSLQSLIVLVVGLMGIGASWAQSTMLLSDDQAWLVISSQSTKQEAVEFASTYQREYPSVFVASTVNGRYTVILGFEKKATLAQKKKSLVDSGSIPSDAYLATGERFLELIWSARSEYAISDLSSLRFSEQQIAQSIEQTTSASALAVVANLPSYPDNFLTIRKRPSSKTDAIGRLESGVAVEVLGSDGNWYQIKTSDQKVGWVNGRYLNLQTSASSGFDNDDFAESQNEVVSSGTDLSGGVLSAPLVVSRPVSPNLQPSLPVRTYNHLTGQYTTHYNIPGSIPVQTYNHLTGQYSTHYNNTNIPVSPNIRPSIPVTTYNHLTGQSITRY